MKAEPIHPFSGSLANFATGPQPLLRAHHSTPDGPVAKFENGRGMGRAGLPFTTAIQGQPSLKAEPIHPFLTPLTNFATGPARVGNGFCQAACLNIHEAIGRTAWFRTARYAHGAASRARGLLLVPKNDVADRIAIAQDVGQMLA